MSMARCARPCCKGAAMKVTTLVTLVVGKPDQPVSLPPGEYDKKDLVGADVTELESRGFVVVQAPRKGEAE